MSSSRAESTTPAVRPDARWNRTGSWIVGVDDRGDVRGIEPASRLSRGSSDRCRLGCPTSGRSRLGNRTGLRLSFTRVRTADIRPWIRTAVATAPHACPKGGHSPSGFAPGLPRIRTGVATARTRVRTADIRAGDPHRGWDYTARVSEGRTPALGIRTGVALDPPGPRTSGSGSATRSSTRDLTLEILAFQ